MQAKQKMHFTCTEGAQKIVINVVDQDLLCISCAPLGQAQKPSFFCLPFWNLGFHKAQLSVHNHCFCIFCAPCLSGHRGKHKPKVLLLCRRQQHHQCNWCTKDCGDCRSKDFVHRRCKVHRRNEMVVKSLISKEWVTCIFCFACTFGCACRASKTKDAQPSFCCPICDWKEDAQPLPFHSTITTFGCTGFVA